MKWGRAFAPDAPQLMQFHVTRRRPGSDEPPPFELILWVHIIPTTKWECGSAISPCECKVAYLIDPTTPMPKGAIPVRANHCLCLCYGEIIE
jgi:hypothetical protein